MEQVLTSYLSDLRMEIAGTHSYRWSDEIEIEALTTAA